MERKAVSASKTNEGFFVWLFRILTFPCSIYKFLFQKGILEFKMCMDFNLN